MTANALPQIVSFAETGRLVGSGHLVRQRALESCLSLRGAAFTLVGFEGTLEPSDFHGHLTGADIAIFDVSSDLSSQLTTASELGVVTCALDWFGEERPDIAFTIFPHGPSDGKLLSKVGPELIVIRQDILRELWTPGPARAYDVVVCLGSADLNRQTHRLCETLGAQGLNVAGIFGPLAAPPPPTSTYSQLFDPPSIGRVMRSASIAVTNGGTCLFEAMTLGVRSISLPQTPAEVSIAEWLRVPRIDACGMPLDDAPNIVDVIRNKDPHGDVHRAFDGFGAERMAQAILDTWMGVSIS